MSLTDHFEPISDPGFYQTVKPAEARRQFNMSVGLVAILAVVATLVGTTLGFGNVQQMAHASTAKPTVLVVQAPTFVHTRHAADDSARLPGG